MSVHVRNEAWSVILDQLATTGWFKISDLPFEEADRHTVRRTIREMEELGWVSREGNRAPKWKRGPVADKLLQHHE